MWEKEGSNGDEWGYLHWFPFASGWGGRAQIQEILESTHFLLSLSIEQDFSVFILILCTGEYGEKAAIMKFLP